MILNKICLLLVPIEPEKLAPNFCYLSMLEKLTYGISFVSVGTVRDNKITCSRTLSLVASADAQRAPPATSSRGHAAGTSRVPLVGGTRVPGGLHVTLGEAAISRGDGRPVGRYAAGACPVPCPCTEQGACRREAGASGRAALADGTCPVRSLGRWHGHRATLCQKQQLSSQEGGVCWPGPAAAG